MLTLAFHYSTFLYTFLYIRFIMAFRLHQDPDYLLSFCLKGCSHLHFTIQRFFICLFIYDSLWRSGYSRTLIIYWVFVWKDAHTCISLFNVSLYVSLYSIQIRKKVNYSELMQSLYPVHIGKKETLSSEGYLRDLTPNWYLFDCRILKETHLSMMRSVRNEMTSSLSC